MVFLTNLTAYLTVANGSAIITAYLYSVTSQTLSNEKPETWDFDKLLTLKWI